jgi:cell division protein FtsQ
MMVAALSGALFFLVATAGGSVTRDVPSLAGILDKGMLTAGFGIEQVEIAGHRATADVDVFDTLDLANVHSLVRFDSRAVRERIERLPWVNTAEVSRVFPGRIRITISERAPFAVWLRGPQAHLIDRTGRVLSAVSPGAVIDLPRISGEGAAVVAAQLYETLHHFPAVEARLSLAERIGERRWRLVLEDGSRLELPADAVEGALARIGETAALASLLEKGPRVIDLRVADRVAIRSAEPVLSALPPPLGVQTLAGRAAWRPAQ